MERRIADDDVRAALRTAVQDTYLSDAVLFGDRTNERSILFHIGRRLVPIVARWGDRWSVDLEYNRWHADELAIVKTKVLQLSPRSPVRRVYPDLVIHDRSASREDCNLLVLEAKHAPRRADRLSDYQKLVAFKQSFAYQHAVFLEFSAGGNPPRWCWMPHEAGLVPDFTGPEWVSQAVF